jgi:hypothetical protein
MRGQAFAVMCAAPFVMIVPERAFAYAPHAVVVPEPPAEETPRKGPFSSTRGGKTSRPPLPEDQGGDDDVPVNPHAVDSDAIDVPDPARAGLSDIRYDVEALPPAVAQTRRRLIEAARTGDIEALRPVFGAQKGAPVTGFSAVEDPVAHLKRQSGDDAGREILAILIELLEAGYVHVGPSDGGTYVWPYFAEVPLDALRPRHYVEVYRILTAIDVEELQRMGRYTFFRVGISHDGRLRYFTAGDPQ